MKTQQYNETERVTRESNYYDPESVKKFLMKEKIKDPRPLINVCDRFGFIEEMVKFFVKNGQNKYVKVFSAVDYKLVYYFTTLCFSIFGRRVGTLQEWTLPTDSWSLNGSLLRVLPLRGVFLRN